ncbi:dihydroorotate dehydrogenase (quinone) [Arthrobacter sp. Hiyo4]|nr:dihydroorotate dehydrogenase (quinone) [Arthrobacter sp. Hiyo4]
MRVYPTFFRLAFSWMDAERAHKIGFQGIKLAHTSGGGRLLHRFTAPSASLQTSAFGLTFPSPFGLAAGFDKEGFGIEALTELGFGHVEVGTITGQAQPGNEKPRLFRLVEDRAVINRMGFNNDGAAAIEPRLKAARAALQRRHPNVRPVIGVNIGKSKVVELDDAVADYLISARSLAPAADYLVVNVSSPNTPGLRLLQDVQTLRPLLTAVGTRRTRRQAGTSRCWSRSHRTSAMRTSTTSPSWPWTSSWTALSLPTPRSGVRGWRRRPRKWPHAAPGPVRSTAEAAFIGSPSPAQGGHRGTITLVAVGGVETAKDVQDRLDAGATLVQGYTAFLYEGPFWAARINRDLAKARRNR